MHALTHHLPGLAIAGLAIIVLVWRLWLSWERVAIWILTALALVYVWLCSVLSWMGRSGNPCRRCAGLGECLSTCRARQDWDAKGVRK